MLACVADMTFRSIAPLADCYSRAWYYGFARNFLRYFPQELRDTVYNLLAAKAYVIMERQKTMIYVQPVKDTTRARVHAQDTVTYNQLPTYYQKAYMGPEFAAEIIAVVYRTRSFFIKHQAEIPGFLSQDIFGTACIPANHIASLHIEVSIRRWDMKAKNKSAWSSSKWPEPYKEHYLKAIKPLDGLLAIAPKQGANLNLVFDPHWYRQKTHVTRLAAALVPFVYALKDKGWDVRCQTIDYRGEGSSIEHQIDYRLSRQEWERKIETDSMFVSVYGKGDASALIQVFYSLAKTRLRSRERSSSRLLSTAWTDIDYTEETENIKVILDHMTHT